MKAASAAFFIFFFLVVQVLVNFCKLAPEYFIRFLLLFSTQKNNMKHFVLFFTAYFAVISLSFSQLSKGGLPISFSKNINNVVDRIEIQPVSSSIIQAEDNKFPKEGYPVRVGYSLPTDISMDNSGTWTELTEGGKIWQVQVKSPGALAIGVYFDKFRIPYGSRLFLYNEDKTQVIGAFTSENNDRSGLFATELIYGDIVNIEYFEPEIVMFKPEFHIDNISYCYKGVSSHKNPNWTEPSHACEVNVNCSPVGDNWKDEKQGVARMYIKIGTGYYWCSGSLVNNTNQDCAPYFLSAYHCYEGASAADLNQWLFYFNYESSGCTTPTTEPSSNTLTGASLKSLGSITGGSDFILLRLNQSVPQSYNPYYNGWSRLNSLTGPGVGIHHPAGSIKKISSYNSASTGTYTGGAASAHWSLSWVSNSNGWGVTEGGSSGSPLFDASGKIVGTLTGGLSYCTAQSDPDYYGKMYYHWDMNGSTASARLKDWLDPAGTNPTSLAGKYCSSGTPVCDTVSLMSSGLYWYSYANGNNSYGDKAKVNYYSTTNNTKAIKDVYVQFIFAKGTGNATVGIWDNSGTSGSPGASPLATTTVPISTVINDVNASDWTHFSFSSPVALTGPCYVGVNLPTTTGDTLVLIADTSANGSYNVAWEKWNNNSWYSYTHASSWGISTALGIWPVICTSSGISEIETSGISIFPNPASHEINIVFNESSKGIINIKVYDVYGKLCKSMELNLSDKNQVQVAVDDLSEGLYFINGETETNSFTQKILIVR